MDPLDRYTDRAEGKTPCGKPYEHDRHVFGTSVGTYESCDGKPRTR